MGCFEKQCARPWVLNTYESLKALVALLEKQDNL